MVAYGTAELRGVHRRDNKVNTSRAQRAKPRRAVVVARQALMTGKSVPRKKRRTTTPPSRCAWDCSTGYVCTRDAYGVG